MLVCVPLTAAFKFTRCHLHLGGAKLSGLGRLHIEGSKPYACESNALNLRWISGNISLKVKLAPVILILMCQ